MAFRACPGCGGQLVSSATYCGNCGYRFPVAAPLSIPGDTVPSWEHLSGDARVLAASHAWHATPGDYSSLRGMRLRGDGSGDLVYGYGQAVYAEVDCRWEVAGGMLRLTYLSPPEERFAGVLSRCGSDRRKEIAYTLTEGEVRGVESIVGWPYLYRWTLELAASPWPEYVEQWLAETLAAALAREDADERYLKQRFQPPWIFYGHREEQPKHTGNG